MWRVVLLGLWAAAIPAHAERGLAGGDCTGTFRLLMENEYTSVAHFRAVFKNAEPRPLSSSHETDNVDFIGVAKSAEGKKYVYVHVALKVLKELNDRLFKGDEAEGKEDVNAARNLFRALLAENLDAFPALKKALRGRFMDFKTVELALDPNGYPGGKEQLHRDVDYLLRQTNLQFEKSIFRIYGFQSELLQRVMQEHGLVSDLTAWHLSGVAEGDPDLAAFASREAVAKFDREKSFVLKANHFSAESAEARVNRIETGRTSLVASLGPDSPVLARDSTGKHLILSRDSIDLLRKVNAPGAVEYVTVVRDSFRKRLEVELTDEQISQLRDYFSEADRFQPSIRAPKRVQIDMRAAKHGIISVDFAGQNVVNMAETMGALAEAHSRGENKGMTAVRLARAGELRATERLERLKRNFEESLREAGISGKSQFSGDDGVLVLVAPLEPGQYEALQTSLGRRPDPMSEYRLVPTGTVRQEKSPSEVDTGGISRETVKGEEFEKKLRTELYGPLPRSRVAASGISVELDPGSKTALVTFPGGWTPAEVAAVKRIIAEKKFAPAGYVVTYPDFSKSLQFSCSLLK